VNVAAVAAVLVAAAFPALAQSLQPVPSLQPHAVYRSTAALVALTVTVQDKTAKYVAGLQRDDFVIYEDGVKQDVRFFEAAAVPLDLIVLIDTSSSMADKVAIVHDAASGFLRTLRDGDRGAVVGFSESVAILQPLSGDRGLLEKAVRTQAPGDPPR